MTVISRKPRGRAGVDSTECKARFFLVLACVWPLCLLALFASSAPHIAENDGKRALSLQFRNVLDRVDVMGYGPTHPRIAAVIVGKEPSEIQTSVESILQTTDRNRIFIITVVVDGSPADTRFVEDLNRLDAAASTKHSVRSATADSSDTLHSEQKIHVIFNEEPVGLYQSRSDAVHFIHLLEDSHENEGLKSHEEDLILVLMQAGAQMVNNHWLNPVTEALIVPPPILGKNDASVALKLANAVAFNLEGHGQVTAFDASLAPMTISAAAKDIALSNGDSYPTPALNGAATAMRLHTYMNLPLVSNDAADWAVNLDLALALWLCADGIDMIRNVDVTRMRAADTAPLEPESAARIAGIWMDEIVGRKFFEAYSKIYSEITRYEWDMLLAQARAEGSHPKCRSFEWYVNEINPELVAPLQEAADALKQDKDKASTAGDSSNPMIHDTRPKPSKPLCPECLEIVQKAKPIDITFVDVSNGHLDHPHKGAVDANGVPGYIHDETALRKNPGNFEEVDPMSLKESCLNRDNTYKMLTEKVFVDMDYDATMQGKDRPKIFCLVYTISQFHDRIPNIRKTWGPKCDGFMVGSNLTDPSLGTVNVIHDGPEEYNNIWQKVRSMWSYIYDNYYEKYDWFHIGGDDYYLLVENFRQYLESEEIRTAQNGGVYLSSGDEKEQTPLFLGRRFAYMGDMNDIFNSGGSGYTLNKAALKTLVVDAFPTFFPNLKTFSEDTMVAKALRQHNIFPYDTKDEAGGERYMPFMPGHHYGFRLKDAPPSDWYVKYSINIKDGVDHCAARSIAFHYVKEPDMIRLHALLYKLCPQGTVDY